MSTLTATLQINNTVYSLSNGAPFELVSIDGLGVIETRAITERGPLQHGDTDKDFRLEPRLLTLVLQSRPGAMSYPQARARLSKIFSPSNVPAVLLLTFADGSQYALDTRSLRVDLPANLDQTRLLRAGVQLRAANPLFYNPVQKAVSFGLAAGGASAFLVPTSVPTFFGASTIDQTLPIAYAGTFKTFPTIEIYGPCLSPVLTNTTTGDKLDFTGITLLNTDWYTIELRYGRKFVYKNGVTTDIRTGELTTDSDLASFCLESDPTVLDGLNSLRFTASGVNASTQVYVRYFERFTGV